MMVQSLAPAPLLILATIHAATCIAQGGMLPLNGCNVVPAVLHGDNDDALPALLFEGVNL